MGIDNPFKLTPADERYALAHAYVPEQIPSLMATISHAGPFLIEEYLGYAKDNWVIFVGYPLKGQYAPARCDDLLSRMLDLHRPEYLWFIGPEIPPKLGRSCRVRESDQYFRLDLKDVTINASLLREVNQAARMLTVTRERTFTGEHQALVDELIRREELPPMIAELYRSMPEYVAHSETARTLNARDAQGSLTAFFVLELAAEQFDTYLLGCYSKKNYVPHASDLLFNEMISFARERGKQTINLGLGVNEGVRRFKMKWGGKPHLRYEFCEGYFGPSKVFSILKTLLRLKP